MKKQTLQCLVIDRDVEVTASLDAALCHANTPHELQRIASMQLLIPALIQKPHLLFCPPAHAESIALLLETLQRHSPDTLLVQVSHEEWQGLTNWLAGVESCVLPIHDVDYFAQYVDFLLHYARLKHEFRQSKHLLGVAELRCHWLVDYSWEAIAYVAQGGHLYANNAYLSLFGFASPAALRALPVSQLVATDERKTFEALGRAADVGNRPSNRVLISLRTLTGETIRAEVRFIPAVLKGKRCYQLHVRPLERPTRAAAVVTVPLSPWDQALTPSKMADPQTPIMPAVLAKPLEPPPSPSVKLSMPALDGMQEMFTPAMILRERLPALSFAEPIFQPQPGRRFSYSSLVRRLRADNARFRLDYWNIGQALVHVSARKSSQPLYWVLVGVGEWIFKQDEARKRLARLFMAAPQAAASIVIAVEYRDCLADMRAIGNVSKLLRQFGVLLAIDNVVDDKRLLPLVRALKPVLVRLSPEWAANVTVDTEEARYLHKLTHQLSEAGSRVIISGVNDVATLNLVCATSAAYLQGRIVKQQDVLREGVK
ncbi:EAL domain-containing protein [Candidatus Thiothrix anitrata]|uniref:EAL domain-containing protein n=1 Tax=Candidatus Thiothrix anitrata TaxID=2823902 RepID=A0ABX7WY65_9GAMM|nr:EAL domain-containing protein [Candidatus Thiothrix anitrata]QTR48619.1 EAL domain-containing protein [Candidatus Thiothrix anitrata]